MSATIEVRDLIRACERWAKLGWAVQEQAVDVIINGEGPEAQNPSAIEQVRRFLVQAGVDADEIEELLG